jgi:hypothetical protein
MNAGEQAVLAASAYADELGEGSGHWLRLRMVDGSELRGTCNKPEQGIMRMEIFTEGEGVNHAEPVWVVLDKVQSVQIDW